MLSCIPKSTSLYCFGLNRIIPLDQQAPLTSMLLYHLSDAPSWQLS